MKNGVPHIYFILFVIYVLLNLSCGYASTNTDDGTDSDTESFWDTVFQEPVMLEIVNHTNAPLFLDNLLGIKSNSAWGSPVSIRASAGGDVDPYWVSLPACGMLPCEDIGTDEDACCVDCGSPVAVQMILPTESISIEWDGMLGSIDSSRCAECACYARKHPHEGAYRIEVCFYPSAECREGPVENCALPTTTGSYTEIAVAGEASCRSFDFDLPFSSGVMVLNVVD